MCVPSAGPDNAYFNMYWMDRDEYKDIHKEGIATHELGHALGIGEHKDASLYFDTVMFVTIFLITINYINMRDTI